MSGPAPPLIAQPKRLPGRFGDGDPAYARLESGQIAGMRDYRFSPIAPPRPGTGKLSTYLTGRDPVTRMSTSLLALCCQSGLVATLATPISARNRSTGSRSLRIY